MAQKNDTNNKMIATKNAQPQTRQKLYQQALLSHHKNPVGYNQEINHNVSASGNNSACGDEITVQVQMNDKQLYKIAFSGDSCAICRASASMMCESLINISVETAKKHIKMSLDCLSEQQDVFPENIAPLAAVKQYPVRIQCAQLPWQTLQKIALFHDTNGNDKKENA